MWTKDELEVSVHGAQKVKKEADLEDIEILSYSISEEPLKGKLEFC